MTYDDLFDFVSQRDGLHYRKPVALINILLESEGIATIRQLAERVFAEDLSRHKESTILAYERLLTSGSARTLQALAVIELTGDVVRLSVDRLTPGQTSQLKALCEQQILTLACRRVVDPCEESGIKDSGAFEPVPDEARHLALQTANGRCMLCGVPASQTKLEVCHAVRPQCGGSNEPANLQVLCVACARSKVEQERSDVRRIAQAYKADCKFCFRREEWTVAEHGSVWALRDSYPVTEGHHLVIPKRHASDLFAMTERERLEADRLIQQVCVKLVSADPTIEGFNVGMNCGPEAGQSVIHAHWHVIPRRKGDSKGKKGGVRGVIPEKMAY